MTPNEKAKELVNIYYHSMNPNAPDCNISYNQAKQCAIVTVDEILNSYNWPSYELNYWKEVKAEIEKL
jgi:hypothetical protein